MEVKGTAVRSIPEFVQKHFPLRYQEWLNSMPEESKKSPSETFTEMMKNFGSAMAEIFNDPKLKEKAKEFGESASASAETLAKRFKDEDVKKKFKDAGQAAQDFGKSVGDYFKDF